MFHNRHKRTILGVTKYQHWKQSLTSESASKLGMEWSISDMIMDKRLKWLGHLDWMDDERLPKKMLFGELRKRRACHGPKKRWRDLVVLDLQAVGLKEDWYWLC